MIDKIVALACLIMVFGCAPATTPNRHSSTDGLQGVSPQQIQHALTQLNADSAKSQLSGLSFLGRFPTLIQAHHARIALLSREGQSPSVRQKAQALLDSYQK